MSKVLEALPGDSQRPSLEKLQDVRSAPSAGRADRARRGHAETMPAQLSRRSGVRRTTDRTRYGWSRKPTVGESPS